MSSDSDSEETNYFPRTIGENVWCLVQLGGANIANLDYIEIHIFYLKFKHRDQDWPGSG